MGALQPVDPLSGGFKWKTRNLCLLLMLDWQDGAYVSLDLRLNMSDNADSVCDTVCVYG